MQILFPFSVIYKNRRGYSPRRFSLFLSRASLREFSFLALSQDIIPLDCVFFRGILSRLTMSFSAEFCSAFIFFFFRAIRLPALYVRFCGIIFRPPHGALMHRHPLYRTSCPVMVYTFSPRRMKI